MSRFALFIAAALVALPAEAAVSKTEKGVRVVRGASLAQSPAPPSLKGAPAPCACRMIVLTIDVGRPPERLTTHRWRGEAFDARLPLTTTGFFADRMARGL